MFGEVMSADIASRERSHRPAFANFRSDVFGKASASVAAVIRGAGCAIPKSWAPCRRCSSAGVQPLTPKGWLKSGKQHAYNPFMSSQFDDLKKQVRALPASEKAALVRVLIDELDPQRDPDVEELWLEEAERRYAQYLRGEVDAIPGDEVMAEARKRLK